MYSYSNKKAEGTANRLGQIQEAALDAMIGIEVVRILGGGEGCAVEGVFRFLDVLPLLGLLALRL
jgi:hypothetical protein